MLTLNEQKQMYKDIMAEVAGIIYRRLDEGKDGSTNYMIPLPKNVEMSQLMFARCSHLLNVFKNASSERKKQMLIMMDAFCKYAESE